jgi:signal transduction histidine kinase
MIQILLNLEILKMNSELREFLLKDKVFNIFIFPLFYLSYFFATDIDWKYLKLIVIILNFFLFKKAFKIAEEKKVQLKFYFHFLPILYMLTIYFVFKLVHFEIYLVYIFMNLQIGLRGLRKIQTQDNISMKNATPQSERSKISSKIINISSLSPNEEYHSKSLAIESLYNNIPCGFFSLEFSSEISEDFNIIFHNNFIAKIFHQFDRSNSSDEINEIKLKHFIHTLFCNMSFEDDQVLSPCKKSKFYSPAVSLIHVLSEKFNTNHHFLNLGTGKVFLQTIKQFDIKCRFSHDTVYEFILVEKFSSKEDVELVRSELDSKGLYLAKVAHEFKNIIISITNCCTEQVSNLSVIRGDSSSDEEEEEKRTSKRKRGTLNSRSSLSTDNSSFIISLCNYLLILIEDLNTFVKIENRNNTVQHQQQNPEQSILNKKSPQRISAANFTDIELASCLDFCINIFKIRQKSDMNKKHVLILSDYELSKSRKVYTNEIKLKQIIVNLLSNAYKFTMKGEVVLSAKVIQEQAGFNKIRISIKDSGTGISDREKVSLFTPFKTIERNQKLNQHGSGLGLCIVNELLSQLDSRLELISEQNAGSLFWFDIPDVTENNIKLRTGSFVSSDFNETVFNNITESSNGSEVFLEQNKIFTESMKNLISVINSGPINSNLHLTNTKTINLQSLNHLNQDEPNIEHISNLNSTNTLQSRVERLSVENYVIHESDNEDISPINTVRNYSNKKCSPTPMRGKNEKVNFTNVAKVNNILRKISSKRNLKRVLQSPSPIKSGKNSPYYQNNTPNSSASSIINTNNTNIFNFNLNLTNNFVSSSSPMIQQELNILNTQLNNFAVKANNINHITNSLSNVNTGATGTQSFNRKKLRIVICDDDSNIVHSSSKIIKQIFSEAELRTKYEPHILTCYNGLECLYNIYQEYINKNFIDILLIDETMPFLNGSVVCHILKNMIMNKQINEFLIYSVSSFEQSIGLDTKAFTDVLNKPLKKDVAKRIFGKFLESG